MILLCILKLFFPPIIFIAILSKLLRYYESYCFNLSFFLIQIFNMNTKKAHFHKNSINKENNLQKITIRSAILQYTNSTIFKYINENL